MSTDINLDETCYEIGKQLVDEAMLIFKQTNEVSPDLCVCLYSMKRAIIKIKNHIEKGVPLNFICLRFHNVQIVTICVNINYIKKYKAYHDVSS